MLLVKIKTHRDTVTTTLHLTEENIMSFLKDIQSEKFCTLGGKVVIGGMKELDIFQVLSKNYDYFDAEKGYHYIEMETITGEWTPVELEEYDPDFYPIETDITMTFVQKYLNPEKGVMLIIKDDIIATYYPNESILEINNSRFNLGGDVQYGVYSRISLENSEKFMELGDIFCESDEHGKYSEKTGKDIQNAFGYLNSKIEAKTGIKDFFGIRKKAIHKDYPILLK